MEKNEEIRISPDALIAMVVAEAEARELASMPSIEKMNEEFVPSEKFQRKMEILLQKVHRKRAKEKFVKGCKKGLITVVSLISILSCTMLPVKAVQEAVIETLINWQEEFVEILFSVNDGVISDGPHHIQDTYIPEGFALAEPISRGEDTYYARYTNADGQWYMIWAAVIDGRQSLALDSEYTTYYSLEFAGKQAIWGILQDGSNVLVWEYDRIAFQVVGNLDLTEIVKISENIQT